MTEPKQSHRRRMTIYLVVVLVGILVVVVGLLLVNTARNNSATTIPSGTQPLGTVGQLRPATVEEATEARSSVGYHELTRDARGPIDYPVQVASGHITTAPADRPNIIIMGAGTTWDGALGHTILVLKSPNEQAGKWHAAWAQVIYDPWCHAQELGLATPEACASSSAERNAVQPGEQILRPFTQAEVDAYRATGAVHQVMGQYVLTEWTTPVGSTTKFVATPQTTTRGNISVLFTTVLQPGQQITGGQLGTRTLIGPGLTKVYYSSDDSNSGLVHDEIEDPVAQSCKTSGIREYLSPKKIAEYQAFCV